MSLYLKNISKIDDLITMGKRLRKYNECDGQLYFESKYLNIGQLDFVVNLSTFDFGLFLFLMSKFILVLFKKNINVTLCFNVAH